MLSRREGFTVVETMIVLAIAAVILSVVFLAVPSVRRLQRTSQANKDLNAIIQGVDFSRQYNHKQLRLITGNNCSSCICRPPATMDSTACVNNWQNAVNKITNPLIDISYVTQDPWGNPYGLDENEGEASLPACTQDNIRSAGPDGVINNADDIARNIPLKQTPCP